MKSIALEDSEIDLLISMYEEELNEAENYIEILSKTLKKLRKQKRTTEIPDNKPAKKRGRKPTVKVKKSKEEKVPAIPGKRGRKPSVIAVKESEPVIATPAKRGPKSKKAQEGVLNILTAIEKEKTAKKKPGPKPKIAVKEPAKRGRKAKSTFQPLVQLISEPEAKTPQTPEPVNEEKKKKPTKKELAKKVVKSEKAAKVAKEVKAPKVVKAPKKAKTSEKAKSPKGKKAPKTITPAKSLEMSPVSQIEATPIVEGSMPEQI